MRQGQAGIGQAGADDLDGQVEVALEGFDDGLFQGEGNLRFILGGGERDGEQSREQAQGERFLHGRPPVNTTLLHIIRFPTPEVPNPGENHPALQAAGFPPFTF